MRERTGLDQKIGAVREIERDLADNLGLIEMGEAEGEASIVDEAQAALQATRDIAAKKELESLLSGEADPNPLPKFFIESVTVRCVMYFTLLYPSCRGTRSRSGPPNGTGRSPSFIPMVSSVCGCSASAISILSHQSLSIEK